MLDEHDEPDNLRKVFDLKLQENAAAPSPARILVPLAGLTIVHEVSTYFRNTELGL